MYTKQCVKAHLNEILFNQYAHYIRYNDVEDVVSMYCTECVIKWWFIQIKKRKLTEYNKKPIGSSINILYNIFIYIFTNK